MIYQAIQYLSQGSLPSPAQLIQLRQQKCKHLLNTSGIDLYQIYSASQLADFTIQQFYFKDVFSNADRVNLNQIFSITMDDYYTHTYPEEREQFFAAVQQLIVWLNNKTSCYVFCQQGIGRSVCVLSTALIHCYAYTPEQLLKILKFLNPNAIMSRHSYSAIQWFQYQLSIHE
ncbi:MAG: hypothetical protein RL637_956 [Pseudomonadota bacterium]|jgi:predicted protein tyrosine phosphatase